MQTNIFKIFLLLFLLLNITSTAKAKECYWEDMKDETIVCDSLVINIPIFFTQTPSHRSNEIHNNEYIFPDNESILTDALNDVANFNAVRSGSKGQQTSLFTRGTNSNHTLVTINGSAITDHSTTNGATDLNNVNVSFADGIHLYTGPMSTIYGPNAIGGVVDIKTSDVKENEIAVTYGSNNTKQTHITISEGLTNFGINFEESDGISVYPKGDEKDGYNILGFNFGHLTKMDNTEIKITGITNNAKSDLDASGADDLDYTADTKFHFGQIQTSTEFDDGILKSVLDATYWDREYVNGTELDEYDSSSIHSATDWITHTDKVSTKTGMDTVWYSAEFNNRGSYNSSVDKEANTTGIYHNFDYVTDLDIIVSGGLRYDYNSIVEGQSTYRVGTAYKGLYFSRSTGYRAPTLYELYGADNYGYSGNENLKAETSVTNEVGYKFGNQTVNGNVSVYSTKIEDMITYGNSTYSNDSNGTSTMKGGDIKLNYYKGNYGFHNSIAFTSAQDSTDNWLKRRPHTIINSSVSYYKDDFYIIPSISYFGKHKDTHSSNYSTITVGSEITADLKTGYNINENSKLELNINNILDNNYERPHGYNQDGRTINLTMKWKF